jgi:hypothetical protein
MNHLALARLCPTLMAVWVLAGCATDLLTEMARQDQPSCAWIL